MKIYDSANLPLQAQAGGNKVTLTVRGQGTSLVPVVVTPSGPTLAVSNRKLEASGRDWYGNTSIIILLNVVNGNTLTVGGKSYVAGTDFAVGGSDTATATNLAAAINLPTLTAQPTWVFNAGSLSFEARVTGTEGSIVICKADIEHSTNGQDWYSLGDGGDPLFDINATSPFSVVVEKEKCYPLLRVKPTALPTSNRLEIWARAA